MSGDVHVRFCKKLGVKFLRPTYPKVSCSRRYPTRADSHVCTSLVIFVYNTCKLRRRSYVFPSQPASVTSSAVTITLIAGVAVMPSFYSCSTHKMHKVKAFNIMSALYRFCAYRKMSPSPDKPICVELL
jgi:hypothetical protein